MEPGFKAQLSVPRVYALYHYSYDDAPWRWMNGWMDGWIIRD